MTAEPGRESVPPTVEFSYDFSEAHFFALQRELVFGPEMKRVLRIGAALTLMGGLSIVYHRSLYGIGAFAFLPLLGVAIGIGLHGALKQNYGVLFAEAPRVRWRLDDDGVHCFHRSGDVSTSWSELIACEVRPGAILMHRRSSRAPLAIPRPPLEAGIADRIVDVARAHELPPALPASVRRSTSHLVVLTLLLWVVLLFGLSVAFFAMPR